MYMLLRLLTEIAAFVLVVAVQRVDWTMWPTWLCLPLLSIPSTRDHPGCSAAALTITEQQQQKRQH